MIASKRIPSGMRAQLAVGRVKRYRARHNLLADHPGILRQPQEGPSRVPSFRPLKKALECIY